MSSEKYVYIEYERYGRLSLIKTTKKPDKYHEIKVQSWWSSHYHMNNVFFIRLMLSLFGLNYWSIFPVEKAWKLFDIIFLLASFNSSLFQVGFSYYTFILNEDPINSVLWSFQAVYALIIRYVLWKRRKKLSSLILVMINILQYRLTRFRRWSIGCIILTILAILFDLFRLVLWFNSPYKKELIDLYDNIHDTHPWIPLQMIAYLDFWTYTYSTIGCLIVSKTFFVFCFHLASESYRNLLPFCRENARDHKKIGCINRQYHKLYNIKDDLNECLNLLPFLWYSHIFFETTSQIVRNTKDVFNLTWQTLLFRWGSYFNLLFITVLITFQVDIYTNRELTTINKVIQVLSETQSNSVNLNKNYLIHKQILIMEMTRSPTIIPNAWNTFEINRSLIVSFFGAVVPFSVMCLEFQQIIN